MTNDSGLFRTRAELDGSGWTLNGNIFERGDDRYLPLYEGRIGHQFNHRFASQPSGGLIAGTNEQFRESLLPSSAGVLGG